MESEPATKSASGWMRWAKLAFRLLVIACVAAGIGHTIWKSLGQFEQHHFSWREVRPGWLFIAGLAYLAGSVPSWWFWHRVLVAMGQQPQPLASFRAYYIGHLGKYVPGKAMVVVLRAALVRGPHVDTAVAAAAVFVETLTLVAVGAVLGGLLVIFNYRDQPWLVASAIGLIVCAAVPAWPPIFRRVVILLRLHRASPQIAPALGRLTFRLMAIGWATMAVGWFLMGFSLWATLAAMPSPPELLENLPHSLSLLTAGVALALVAGFLSMLPGGFGVREFVVMTVLAPAFGEVAAVVSAILLRVIWLLAELAISLVLYLIKPPSTAVTPATTPDLVQPPLERP